MKNAVFALLFLIFGPQAWAQTTTVTVEASATDGPWAIFSGTSKLDGDYATKALCIEGTKAVPRPPATGTERFGCRTITEVIVTRTVIETCQAQPAAESETVACPAGTVGSWVRGRSYVGAPFPTCWAAGSWAPDAAPAGACVIPLIWTRLAAENQSFTLAVNSTMRYGVGTAWTERVFAPGTYQCDTTAFAGIDPLRETVKACDVSSIAPTSAPGTTPPPPTTTPPVTPPTNGATVTLYFSDCQAGSAAGCVPGSNANPGTQAAPKQNLAGINVNTLGAGSQLLFNRGGTWNWTSTVRLDNRNATAAAPLTFGAYGTGAAPELRVSSQFGFETGEWANTFPDRGYVFRGLRFFGLTTAPPDAKAIWLRGTVADVLVEDVEFEGFFIAMYGQGGQDVQRVTVRNSRFLRNKSMGVLGSFNNSLFEGNLFEGNNLTGSGFEHGTYFSNFTNLTLRNNTYLRNSVINGVCQGGNMTFHGLNDGLLIEGNRIEQDASAPGCWLMSITQGYASAEAFLNVIVRNNKLINGGNNAMNAQSSPGILVEGNVIINTNPINQVGISVGHTDYPNGDLPDGGAVVRNNTICQSGGASGPAVTLLNNPGATQTNNVVITGAAATTGVCVR